MTACLTSDECRIEPEWHHCAHWRGAIGKGEFLKATCRRRSEGWRGLRQEEEEEKKLGWRKQCYTVYRKRNKTSCKHNYDVIRIVLQSYLF